MKVAITSERDKIPVNYMAWLKKGGMEPVLVDRLSRLDRINEASAVVFTGGGDIRYWFFKDKNMGKKGDVYRDVLEYKAFLLAKKKAMLGICRGAQVLNVFMGGTLKDLKCAYMHNDESDVFHPMFLKNGVRWVNSRHHQGIDRLAEGFSVTGVYKGVIELAEKDNIILCQYHPERLEDNFILQKFKGIINKTRT